MLIVPRQLSTVHYDYKSLGFKQATSTIDVLSKSAIHEFYFHCIHFFQLLDLDYKIGINFAIFS